MPRLSRTLLLLLSTLLLGGCRNITGPAGGGSYTAEVTGALTASYSGRMIYGPRSVTAGPGYHLHLKLPDDLFNGILFQLPAGPRLGTYRIVAGRGQDLGKQEVLSGLSLPDDVYLGSTGELRISSTRPLRGTFRFLADQRGDVVTVSGQFAED
jgi:hypothetical protein